MLKYVEKFNWNFLTNFLNDIWVDPPKDFRSTYEKRSGWGKVGSVEKFNVLQKIAEFKVKFRNVRGRWFSKRSIKKF